MYSRLVAVITDFKFVIALLALFAIVCGVATFIENDFGTAAARATIYNAKWFELILLLLAFSAIGNILKFKLYRLAKLPILIFHIAFVIIIIGAAVTRYTGYEGIMHIREGDSSNLIVSGDTYLQFKVDNDDRQIAFDQKLFVNPLFNKSINQRVRFLGNKIAIKIDDIIYNAQDSVVATKDGRTYLELISVQNSAMRSIYIEEGGAKVINGLIVAFNNSKMADAVQINIVGNEAVINSHFGGSAMPMDGNDSSPIDNHVDYPFSNRMLYMINDVPLVYKQVHNNVELIKVPGGKAEGNPDNIIDLTLTHNANDYHVRLFGGKGYVSPKTTFKSADLNFSLSYGSKYYRTPFNIKLNDFRLERYPGSDSPSAYESAVTVFDQRISNQGFDHLIYMNNVLNYDGYRFFQSSYDRDELGTVLSVNHDYWGTKVTYLGYSLLIIGMLLTPFMRRSRFSNLGKKVKSLRSNRNVIGIILLLAGITLSPEIASSKPIDIDKEHAEKFSRILVQDYAGRIKPLHTLSSEMLRKVSGKANYQEHNPTQVLIQMITDPLSWQQEPLIKVQHPDLMSRLSITGKRASFLDFFDSNLNYILQEDVLIANRKKPAERNKYDKAVLAVDERVNICYAVFNGELLRIYPLPGDTNNTWLAGSGYQFFNTEDSLFVKTTLPAYAKLLVEATENGDWIHANKMITQICEFQIQHGASVVPRAARINIEILYNKLDLFNRLYGYYLLVGLTLLFVLFVAVFKPSKLGKLAERILSITLIIIFILHTLGLALRWYSGGFAPWSNAYESMVFIGWATVLAGLLFSRKSKMTMGATALLTAIILMVAHLNWLDPEITPLVPVLKSYWLMIHVAIITSSYGFLGLGALLGFINLILMAIRNAEVANKIDNVVAELTHINEMTLSIGVFMAAIGTFLGGVWANESWGRYWGWDPKETWALIIILTYAIILHLRFINKSSYLFNLAALLGFGSVIMTYFGVNYFLSGLHSYAAGDPVPIPTFVYYALGVIGLTAVLAYINNRKQNNYNFNP